MTIPAQTSAMRQAFAEAEAAAARGESPIGAAIFDAESGKIVASSGNRVEELKDPTAHAEILAIRAACAAAGAPRIPGLEIFVTLEPCAMCAAAIAGARLKRLTFSAYDPKGGGVEHGPRIFEQSTCNHRPEVVGGVDEQRASELLRTFFRERR